MERKMFHSLFKSTSTKYDIKEPMYLKSLESEKLQLFFTGSPSSGKTTFLNALLGLSRNELYESTKKATKCIFKISHGIKPKYRREYGVDEDLPENIDARRELLHYFNLHDNSVTLYFPLELLLHTDIYDTPGLFSGDSTDDLFNEIVCTSDLIVLCKNLEDMLTPEESQLIDACKKSGSNYVVLLTFEDLLETSIRNDTQSYKEILDTKKREFRSPVLIQTVSSEDYFRSSLKGNVESVRNFLINEWQSLKAQSVKVKKEMCVNQYLSMLHQRKENCNSQIESEIERLKENGQIEKNRRNTAQRDELGILKTNFANCNDKMDTSLREVFCKSSKTHSDLSRVWEESVSCVQRSLSHYPDVLNSCDVPVLPEYDKIILESYDLEYYARKVNEIAERNRGEINENSKDSIGSAKKFSVLVNKLISIFEKEGTNQTEDAKSSEDIDVLGLLKEFIEKIDDKDITEELYRAFKYSSELKNFRLKCNNCLRNWSDALGKEFVRWNEVELSKIDEQVDASTELVRTKMLEELKINELMNYIGKFEDLKHEYITI